MRILVDARSPGPDGLRLRHALTGLAARGHDVLWLGAPAPDVEGVRAVAREGALHGEEVDLVAAEGARVPTAARVWRTRAHGMLLAVRAEQLRGWSLAQRLAWDLVPAYGLLEGAEAGEAVTHLSERYHGRIALWPEGAPAAGADPAHPDVDVLERAGERLLAARRGPRLRPAAFLDRDGTLIEEHGYLSDPERVTLLPGVARALRQLADAHLALVVISNQAGVGRGRFPLERAWATMARLRRLLRAEGVELDAVRFCPHAPEEGCRCRKPRPGLLEDAAEDLRLSLPASAMVGDKRIDAEAGQAAGAAGVLVRTGYGREEEALLAPGTGRRPDAVLDDLAAFAAWAIARVEAL